MNSYMLEDCTRIFYDGSFEYRIRTGVFNFEEAIINLQNESSNVINEVKSIMTKLMNGEAVEIEYLSNHCEEEEKQAIIELLEGLKASGFISDVITRQTEYTLSSLLIGKSYLIPTDEHIECKKRGIVICDNEAIRKYVTEISKDINMNVDLMEEEYINKIKNADLTTRIDALKMERQYSEFKQYFDAYNLVIVVMKNINLELMRNLNTLLIRYEIPMIVGFLDGPFLNAMAIKYPYTGCFECFEQRVLARLEDHQAYHNFIKGAILSKNDNKGYLPLLNMLSNLVLMEGYQNLLVGTSKLEGRVLSIFIPTLEIQVQDILRVPYCTDCGEISNAKFEEINISSRRIVDDILENTVCKQV